MRPGACSAPALTDQSAARPPESAGTEDSLPAVKVCSGNGARIPVFHVPHAGNGFPKELLASVCVPEKVLLRYHAHMRDTDVWRFIPEQYRDGETTVRFALSRLMCDVERFIGPEEEMERCGMGFCYENAYDGVRIKTVTPEVKELTKKYYEAHHARMDALCARYPRILLLDLHSFSADLLPAPRRAGIARMPDVCIGADKNATPPALIERIEQRLDEARLSYAVNTPYSGAFVPGAVLSGRCDCDLISVMLEFNKRIYCDGRGRADPEKTRRIRALTAAIVDDGIKL